VGGLARGAEGAGKGGGARSPARPRTPQKLPRRRGAGLGLRARPIGGGGGRKERDPSFRSVGASDSNSDSVKWEEGKEGVGRIGGRGGCWMGQLWKMVGLVFLLLRENDCTQSTAHASP